MKKTFGDYFIILLSVIGSLATLVGFYYTFYGQLNDQGKYGVIFLGIIAIWFLIYNLYLVSSYRKKVGYADAFEGLNAGFTILHSIDRNAEEADAKSLIDKLKDTCTNIADAFESIKGHHCGVCIKLIATGKDNRARVITLCRDNKSAQSRPAGQSDKTEHWISENSDFLFIYESIDDDNHIGYYHNGNLPFQYDYSNTRLKAEKKWPPLNVPLLHYLLRFITWPLKYKSTIVVPIVPLSVAEHNKGMLRGFLCVDSPRTFTLNEQADVHILKGVSDGLYNKIDTLQKLLSNG